MIPDKNANEGKKKKRDQWEKGPKEEWIQHKISEWDLSGTCSEVNDDVK